MLTFTPPSNLEQSTSVDCVRTLKHLEGGHTDMRWTCKPHTEPTVRWQRYNYCTTMLQVKYASTTWLLTKQAMQEFFPLIYKYARCCKDSWQLFIFLYKWDGLCMVAGRASMLGLPGWCKAIQGTKPPAAGYWGKPKWDQQLRNKWLSIQWLKTGFVWGNHRMSVF